MPYDNFWAARVRDPNEFSEIVTLKTTTNGILIKGGTLKSDAKGKSKIQTYWFPKKNFNKDEAKTWLESHRIAYQMIEHNDKDGSVDIKETFSLSSDSGQKIEIDEINHTVKNLRMSSKVSLNGYTYTDEAQITGCKLLENYPIYYNHRDKAGRNIRDLIGKVSNPRFMKETDGSFTDAAIHPDEWSRFKGIVNLGLENVGFSWDGMGFYDKEKKEVTVMKRMYDLSLVDGPATTRNLRESQEVDIENIEGVFDDEKRRREVEDEIFEYTWLAISCMRQVMAHKDMKISDKKKMINDIMDDFDNKVTSLTNELASLGGENKESQEMDKKTLEDISNELKSMRDAITAEKEPDVKPIDWKARLASVNRILEGSTLPAKWKKNIEIMDEMMAWEREEEQKAVLAKYARLNESREEPDTGKVDVDVINSLRSAKIIEAWKTDAKIAARLSALDKDAQKKEIEHLESLALSAKDSTRTNTTTKATERTDDKKPDEKECEKKAIEALRF